MIRSVECRSLGVLAATLILLMSAMSCGDRTRSELDSAARGKSVTGANTTEDMSSTFDKIGDQNLHDYIARLDFSMGKSHTRPRKCKPGTGNCSSAQTIDITIKPEHGAKGLGTPSGDYIQLPNGSHGYIIAELFNTSSAETEDWLGLLPGDTAYWLIETDANGNAQSRFVQVHEISPGKWKKGELTKTPLLYFACNHKERKNLEADFADCTNPPPDESSTTPRTAPVDLNSTWMSCPAGCCATASGQQVECKAGQPCADSTKKPARPATKRTGT